MKQSIPCHYSLQKQMGRPKKKKKAGDGGDTTAPNETNEVDPFASLRPVDREALRLNDTLCPKPYSTFMNKYTPSPRASFLTQGPIYEHQECLPSDTFSAANSSNRSMSSTEATPPSHSPPTPRHDDDLTTLTSWPDYSGLPLPEMVKVNKPDNHENDTDFQNLTQLPVLPACPCLPNLYLTLSTLSALNSFPVSKHTIETLQTATRTAHSVLYCPICPTKFQSGMQNVMLLGILISVIGDGWNRIRKTSAKEVYQGFAVNASSSNSANTEDWTSQDEKKWNMFTHYLVRQYVFGDPPPPSVQLPSCNSNIDNSHSSASPIILVKLLDAFERRQNTWHKFEVGDGEFPTHILPEEIEEYMAAIQKQRDTHGGQCSREDHLCLKIVDSVRMVLTSIDRKDEIERGLGEFGKVWINRLGSS